MHWRKKVQYPVTHCPFEAPLLVQMEIRSNSCGFNGRGWALRVLYCKHQFEWTDCPDACLWSFERFTKATNPNKIPTCTFSCLHTCLHLSHANIWVFPSQFHFRVQTTCQSNYSTGGNLGRGEETEERVPSLEEEKGGMFHWCGRRVEGRDSCKDECRIKTSMSHWWHEQRLLRTQGTMRMKRRNMMGVGGCTTPSITMFPQKVMTCSIHPVGGSQILTGFPFLW